MIGPGSHSPDGILRLSRKSEGHQPQNKTEAELTEKYFIRKWFRSEMNVLDSIAIELAQGRRNARRNGPMGEIQLMPTPADARKLLKDDALVGTEDITHIDKAYFAGYDRCRPPGTESASQNSD